ncbi:MULTISPECIES: cadherin-like domain-containing protein [unclassified Acinetobacter]|uniref:cadherin-like domain-containing protein n=1 Tax=unclassified Acinetobacter TaxID=196816 RepID=UPI0015D118EA
MTPNGDIVQTYPDDTDPSTITPDQITVKDPNGKDIVVEFGTPETQPDGSITVTGKVPEDVEGKVTVNVPEGSYEDTSGNLGLPGTGNENINMVPLVAEVTITPDGKITVTYPDDVDPSTITEDKIVVEGPNGPIEVPFTPPVEQPDGSYIVTGEVPPGVDGNVTVTVPTDSYEDESGNPGEEVDKTVPVDNIAPEVETTQVVTIEDQSVTLTWAHFGISDANTANDQLVITVTNLPKDGVLTIVDAAGNKTPIIAGQTLSYADINAGKVVFAPDANEASATDGGVYAGLEFNVSDGKHVTSGELEIVVDAVADKPSLTLDLLDWSPTAVNLNIQTWNNLKTVTVDGKFYNLLQGNGNGMPADTLRTVFEYLTSSKNTTLPPASTSETTSLVEAPEADASEKVLQFTLHAEVLNDAEENVNVNGVKFKSAALDALVDAKVSVNGISVSKDSDGYYTYQGTSSSQVEDFVVKVTVPETSIQDVNVLTTQLETELGNSNNVLPIQETVTATASFAMFSLESESLLIGDDIVFDLLADDNLGGNTLTTVNDFSIADQIDISSLLSDDATEANLAEFVTVEYDEETDSAVISIDRDGTSGAEYESQDLVVLLNQTNKVELDDLINNNQIIY